jgi:histidine triad (HIT) family protein
MPSIFTKIINREIPGHIVAENDEFIAFLDVSPLVEGHTLVVPKKEEDFIFDMEDADLGNLMIFAKAVAHKVKSVVPCKRIGVSVVGLEVPHTHIHLIPMNQVSDMNFAKAKIQVSPDRMAELAEHIRKAV